MARTVNSISDAPTTLAQSLACGALRERVIPRFVDSYVWKNGRHALQVHASLYRDLLTICNEKRCWAACVRALEIASSETITRAKGNSGGSFRKGAEAFAGNF